ncbi:hypothetical protein PoB_002273100 [Plakobranchus ocellatus]|uniref:Uncharacterized protein n=1 Tax=Plakobranchus ocellatus TaxID=259542 RepID=A0AAV3ZJT8_9GAST|nr:hypothetical protein PoB_002273100 [Plakobranchus ocellatus]
MSLIVAYNKQWVKNQALLSTKWVAWSLKTCESKGGEESYGTLSHDVVYAKNNQDPTVSRCFGSVSGIVDSKSALRSARALLSRVRAPPATPWPDGGPGHIQKPKTKPDAWNKRGTHCTQHTQWL